MTFPSLGSSPSCNISVLPTAADAALAAAEAAGATLRDCLRQRGEARIMVGTGNSQLAMIRALVRLPDIEWSKVDAFHLDEYVGLAADHPASFRHWIRKNFAEQVHPRSVHYLEADVADLEAMMGAYGRRLLAAPVDLAFVGIGENGHIAFNDPHVADFEDPRAVKRVALDEGCRRQQVGEGHFPTLDSVPREAVTVTCSGLFRAARWICCVPDARKARAIRGSFEGPISPQCPGSLVRRHPAAAVFLDRDSASLLTPACIEANSRVAGASAGALVAGQ
jgi:glucosamine-6-phosphate deaminase